MSDDVYKPATVAEIRQRMLDQLRYESMPDRIKILTECYVALGFDSTSREPVAVVDPPTNQVR